MDTSSTALVPARHEHSQAPLRGVSLDDKYTARDGRIYLSGIQALVRLPIIQKWRDEAAGLNTAGFVSGYRGSPLGGMDEALWKAEKQLKANNVRFQPGINEDLAATAVWGTQQVGIVGPTDYEGVFAMWYGKAPGVDRSADALKHANHSGASRHGGVLLIAGDDHGAFSSTLPCQSEHIFSACMIPVLYPANVQEYIDLGIHGWAMSRFSGCLVGFKALADTVESSASIDADPFRVQVRLPTDFTMPEGRLNARPYGGFLGKIVRDQEALMQDYKIYAALAYARENKLNRTVIDSPAARLGIIASGKSYMDVLDALEELGIDERKAGEIGIRVFKVAMPWPLEPDGIREFAEGLEEILVVEEKRQIVEYQLKEQLYNWKENVRPRVIGKFDEKGEWVHPRGEWLLPGKAEFSVAQIARVIAGRIGRFHESESIRERIAFLDAKDAILAQAAKTPLRPSWFCSGCPHNTSTRVPEGSIALAGIGCHIMATSIYPEQTRTITHMGGEGAPWIGQAPFSKLKHVFVNLGDGTYFHSGYLAIRASVAAKVNVTYKLLFNDAVAMTGGQPVDGQLSVTDAARQMLAEGVRHVAIVSESPDRFDDEKPLPRGIEIFPRTELDSVQRRLRDIEGVTAIIYDQVCAAEKRRRRKKQEFPDPPRRMFIAEEVCEGCGDCGAKSNCTSILPLETARGRKRQIDQSSCNKDYSCNNGFCPSFVTVTGGRPRKRVARGAGDTMLENPLPHPQLPLLEKPYNILITGIGGTGVITIGALLGMAAHLSGRGVSVLDMTGMSQKNGAVTSHVRLAENPGQIHAQRIATGEADIILGCDMLTSGSQDAISKIRPGRTRAFVNEHEQPTGQFTQNPDWQYPLEQVRTTLASALGESPNYINATGIATALLGDSIATNLFMLGYAWQQGGVPLPEEAILRAIELNGVAIEFNKSAFRWGRHAAHDPERVRKLAIPERAVVLKMPETLEALMARACTQLVQYQSEAYAATYESFVRRVRKLEEAACPRSSPAFTRAVARGLHRLMAYKDEYEVARLFTSDAFRDGLESTFDGDYSISFNFAPPLLSRKDVHGMPVKRRFGAWILPLMAVLKHFRFLRGTPFDPFGHTHDRRLERQLIREYMAAIEQAAAMLTPESRPVALELANAADAIRGYGHVKDKAAGKARAIWSDCLRRLSAVNAPSATEAPLVQSAGTGT